MDTAKEENSIKELIKYVLEHLEEYDEISILPLDEFLDFEVNRKIYEKLLKETDALLAKKDNKKTVKLSFYPHMEPENKLIYIGRSRVNLCGRLHGMMISLCFASVLVPFSYSLKTKIFLESCHFEQIISSESVTKEKIELAICAQSTNDQPYINPKLLSKKSQEACKNYEYLAERLNSLEH